MADPTLDELIEWHVEQKGNRWGYTYKEWDAALAAHLRELRDLRAAVQTVRTMHREYEGWCVKCLRLGFVDGEETTLPVPHPCPTIAALDAGGGA